MKRIVHFGAAFCVALTGFAVTAQAETAYEYAERVGLCEDRGGLAEAEFFDTTNDAGKPAKGLRYRCNSAAAIDPQTGAAIGAGVLLLGIGFGGSGGGDGNSETGTSGTGLSGTSGTN